MKLRRSPGTPRKFVGFRIAAFTVGLLYVLATTNTIQTIGTALAAVNILGDAIVNASGGTSQLNQQEPK